MHQERHLARLIAASAPPCWHKAVLSGIVVFATMRIRSCHPKRSNVLAIILLAALVARAYVPIGFMPASGKAFLVEFCPAAYVTSEPAPHFSQHHSPGHAHFQQCPFGSSPAVALISHFLVREPPGPIVSLVDIAADPKRWSTQLRCAHQPRGPPSPA